MIQRRTGLATLAATAFVASAVPLASAASGDTLCSLPPRSYGDVKTAYANYTSAIEYLEGVGVATWYSDRRINGPYADTAAQLVERCPEDSRLSVVIYGLPNKDCEAGYSAGDGVVQTSEDYAAFIDTLAAAVGDRKALYVLEPDAVGLLAKQGCAIDANYRANLLVAVDKLTNANPNADVYLDVGFWTLMRPEQAPIVVEVVQELVAAGRGRVKGITLNTSNYRPTSEMAELCAAFQAMYGSQDLHCIVDTSRNYNGDQELASEEWCNRRTSGIGHPPTADTGVENVDYFVWLKPPGESDGECDGEDHTAEAMVGPPAGVFFPDMFELLWDNGYPVKELGMPAMRTSDGSDEDSMLLPRSGSASGTAGVEKKLGDSTAAPSPGLIAASGGVACVLIGCVAVFLQRRRKRREMEQDAVVTP